MTYKIANEELMRRYRTIFAQKGNAPTWAYHKISRPSELIHCPVPFVGRKYFEQPVRLLLYASAENLNGYDGYLDDDSFAIQRHRYFFEQSVKKKEFFPMVHIEPISNGALALCALHVLAQWMPIGDVDPTEFLEMISFGNYGKYTICPEQGTRNVDYANDPKKLRESQEYIAADLEILQPDYIIMVGTTYAGAGKQKEFIDSIKGNAKILPMYQITATTINSPLLFRKHAAAELDTLHPTVARWYSKFHAGAVSGKYFLSVFSYLDHILKSI